MGLSCLKADYAAGVVHAVASTFDLVGESNPAYPDQSVTRRTDDWLRSQGLNPSSPAGVTGQFSTAFIPIGGVTAAEINLIRALRARTIAGDHEPSVEASGAGHR